MYSAKFDGSDKKIIHRNERNPIQMFAYDWLRQHMYFKYTKSDKEVQAHFAYAGNETFDDRRPFADASKVTNIYVDPDARLVTY